MFTLVSGLTLTLGLCFNACSDVKFDNASNSGKPPGGLCVPGQITENCVDNENPPRYVDYDETFSVPASTSKVDVLLVLDNSGSMKQDLNKLAERLDGLVQILDNGGIDWQMCHVVTDKDTPSGNALNWVIPGAPNKVMNNMTPNRAQVFLNSINAINDNGSGDERPIYTIRRTLQNAASASCFRNDAALTTIIISDEDERSCGGRCQNYTTSEVPTAKQYRDASSYRSQYRALAANEDGPQELANYIKANYPNKSFVNHTIAIMPGDNGCYDLQDKSSAAYFGVQLGRLQALTGGVLGSICADSYSAQLAIMGQRTRDSINSVTLRCAPYMVRSVAISQAGVNFTISGNKVVFATPVAEGASVRVQYTCAE